MKLDDKYTQQSGSVYLTGIQALVRLPMDQMRRDRREGLNTGAFISGYEGSPLGGYDNALWRARAFLEQHNIHFQPGLNEDLAATSIWGSGASRADMERFAQMYADAASAVLVWSMGITQHDTGSDNVAAIDSDGDALSITLANGTNGGLASNYIVGATSTATGTIDP